MSIGFVSYLFAFSAFLAFTTLMIISWRRISLGALMILASVLSTLWAGVFLTVEFGISIPLKVIQIAEISRSLSWCLFLFAVVEKRSGKSTRSSFPFKFALMLSILLVSFVAMFTSLISVDILEKFNAWVRDVFLVIWIAIAIVGMALVEQLFRNSNDSERWAIKFLCLALGSIFVYDFFMYADALLLKRISPNFWQARGFVNAIAVPFIAISVARNPTYAIDIHVSRQVVFHTATFMGSGVYLLIMSSAGYFIRFYGGTWGGVLQIVFLVGAGALLVILMFSDKIRAKIRVLLSKHFFSYKYDYRDQWQQFTEKLAGQEGTVPEQVIGSIASLVHSPGGVLWGKSDAGAYVLIDRLNMPEPEHLDIDDFKSLDTFIERTRWIVDLEEYHHSPSVYEGLFLPRKLVEILDAWLLVPLIFKDKCIGVVLLRRPKQPININWEDRDLMKMAGQQAASHFAQFQADRALMRGQQFEAFNRLSAYVVHDLKNILAQQSLIVTNAEKHRHNPDFIEDVLATVKNSVGRMTRLMEQMRSGERGNITTEFELGELLKRVVVAAKGRVPTPLLMCDAEFHIIADMEQITTVFGHLVQNAQDATDSRGKILVVVALSSDGRHVTIDIEDTGVGMDAEFIKNRLFKPFDSTKGLTGMGVGAFESREYVRSIGGDIRVTSTLGEGALFRVMLPYDKKMLGVINNDGHIEGVA